LIALLLIASGIWTIYLTVAHGNHAAHGGHSEQQSLDHSKMQH
jgi:hypothetical protein